MGKKFIEEVIIPEHWEYECDFFHVDEEEPIPMDKLYGIKVQKGGGKSYAMLVSPTSDNAAFIICEKCLGNFGAMDTQARNSINPLRSSNTDHPEKTGTE